MFDVSLNFPKMLDQGENNHDNIYDKNAGGSLCWKSLPRVAMDLNHDSVSSVTESYTLQGRILLHASSSRTECREDSVFFMMKSFLEQGRFCCFFI